MLSAFLRDYHRRLCQTGERLDIRNLWYEAPRASTPWSLALLIVMLLTMLLENATGQLLWYLKPDYLRWIIFSAFLTTMVGAAYATITVFVCACRAEFQRDR